jgi:hypothetical protein
VPAFLSSLREPHNLLRRMNLTTAVTALAHRHRDLDG